MDFNLLGDRPLAPRAIHRNFLFMTICFAVNHGCVISVLNLSVVLLGTEPGAFQTGSLYVTYAASALLFATPLLDALGSRRALVYASATYCVYVASVPLVELASELRRTAASRRRAAPCTQILPARRRTP